MLTMSNHQKTEDKAPAAPGLISVSAPPRSFGWIPDYPDFRDSTIQTENVPSRLQVLEQPSVKDMLSSVGMASTPAKLPTTVDLRS
jgi:hypothetical protein